jgi:hypothetical protein
LTPHTYPVMQQEASATRKCTTDANVVMKGELSLRTP